MKKRFSILSLFILIFFVASYGQDEFKQVCCDPVGLGIICFKKGEQNLDSIARGYLDGLIAMGSDISFTSYSSDLCKPCGQIAISRIPNIVGYLRKKGFKGRIAAKCITGADRDYVAWLTGPLPNDTLFFTGSTESLYFFCAVRLTNSE